ncbi:MAG: hypothetical protein ACK58L_02925 [Planctomycetota bacterium]
MLEVVGLWLVLIGSVLVLFGLLWLVRVAWKTHKVLGIVTLLTIPIGPLMLGLCKLRSARAPLSVVLVGLIVGAVPYWYGGLHDRLFGRSEQVRVIEGDVHLILTGADHDNYDQLKTATDVVVLEMANADVTDATLELLLPMTRLRELTLDDTQVTDTGLAVLRKLPALETLRLARTKVTKEGVEQFLSDPPPRLINLNVKGNSIPTAILRKWKNAEPETRKYLN